MEDGEPEFVWTGRDRKFSKFLSVGTFFFVSGWIIFLMVTLAPSCPSLKPKTAEDYFNYGEHYMSMGDFIQAERWFSKAIKMKPEYFEAYIERAKSYEQSDSLQKAINDYTALLSFPNMTVVRKGELLWLRADDYYKSLQDSLACKDWKDACELNLNKACTSYRKNCKK